MKYCPFTIDGPTYQRRYGAQSHTTLIATGMDRLHTMQDWERKIDAVNPNYIMMPMVRFQAQLHYRRMADGRVLMLDDYDRQWSVFASAADEVLPAMHGGVLNAWWVMTKKGKAYGLMVDLQKPPMSQVPAKEDVPRMLERVTDLKTVMANFEAMAV